jgi:hypothetical protein
MTENNESKCSKSEWFPENNPPTYNPGVDGYQMAIIPSDRLRIIPGFAFGETEEECLANAWMLSASKDLFKAFQAVLMDSPNKHELTTYALSKAMGELKNKIK